MTPATKFMAMLAIVGFQVRMVTGETYWTYFQDPLVINSATWAGGSILVFTNYSAINGEGVNLIFISFPIITLVVLILDIIL